MIELSPLNRLIRHECQKILEILSQTWSQAHQAYNLGNSELADRYLELHQEYQNKIVAAQKGIFQ